ncbi:rhamnogalacturonan acetylesterase [Gilvimarinus xylanilyticus]|uniref:Rhamnogalacturonan acetylesterase n=1 Tax=Gilvimarinus xylanilyticus TaxID=2944139 RepID=A0A9X2HVC6_9GAMM|nr:rhamnogalacturonan acetylesterase [Gilvimarinus xylanilyticus]MCP8898870.1 rhamnogalacturonan acetylesterase [Gilvimarinus xylanilyticus]
MIRKLFAALAVVASATAVADERPTHVFMAGDSTMSIKHVKDYPETGWGVPFAYFFDEGIAVDNRARNGRSTRTFIEEGIWQGIVDELQAGDYVIIQFGHNDQSEHKKDRYTPPETYQANLKRFIADVKKAGASPLLMTPVTRRYFNDQGQIEPTHNGYDQLVREVAEQTGVFFVDMEAVTRAYFTDMGDELSKLRFMHIGPDLHPNYPIGVTDDTHFNHLGAREVAQLVLSELKKQQHPLAKRLRVPDPKHLRQ